MDRIPPLGRARERILELEEEIFALRHAVAVGEMRGGRAAPATGCGRLSAREQQVLNLLAIGLANKQIATRLRIS